MSNTTRRGLLTDDWAALTGLCWVEAAQLRDTVPYRYAWLSLLLSSVKDRALWVKTYLQEPEFRTWSDQWDDTYQQQLLDAFLATKEYEKVTRLGSESPSEDLITELKSSQAYSDYLSGNQKSWGAVIGLAKKKQPNISIPELTKALGGP